MKIKSIGSASSLVGAAVAVTGFLAAACAGVPWWVALITGGVLFLVGYGMSDFVLRKFVVYKLKPIYQVALSKNLKTSELEHELARKRNMVGDIESELSNWAETNRREIARLKETEKYRKEYIGNVSHEMKTPIFNVQGYILTLLDGAIDDSAINRKYLERAEKSIDRLINIVTDLEEISKLESGVLKLDMERFDIVALAREIVEATEMEAGKRNIRIVVGPSHGTPLQPMFVMADKHYISQVFINLIINSIKYGNVGGRTKISFIDLFDKVMVEVSDNGVGIEKDDIPRVFERFYRTDKSRSREQGGTGLGLSIVKHIMEAHGESITLRSEPGKGSTFSFTLSKK